MGYSSVLPARRCWQGLREFALLNGGSAAIEENRNEEPFKDIVGRGPCVGIGFDRRFSRGAAATSAQAGFAGGLGRGAGNSGDEGSERHVCQHYSQYCRANQGRFAAEQPQLPKGSQ